MPEASDKYIIRNFVQCVQNCRKKSLKIDVAKNNKNIIVVLVLNFL